MATRAVAFTAKIRNLKDYQYRMVNSLSPLPSGVDIANTLKYFSQTLLSVLKDVPIMPMENYGLRQRDSLRLAVFPNLNYSGLYEAVMSIIDVVPMVQHGQHALGESVLTLLGCLVPFLEYDRLDTLPYTVASTLAIFPNTLQVDTVQLLCTNLLPVTLGYAGLNENPTYASESMAAVIMLVFQYVHAPECHSQLCECIMSLKKNICKDLLSVVAFGPPAARAPAINHLFHYWPQMNPVLFDRRGTHYKFSAWPPVSCQMDDCRNKRNVKAIKMCLDPTIAVECGDRPPPLYVCEDCAEELRMEHAQYLVDILQPLQHVPLVCENKNCSSAKNIAVCTCFSTECASLSGFRPMRYCIACHQGKHGTSPAHVYHLSIPSVWSCDPELQSYLVEAVVSLLKEAQPLEDKRTVEMGEERTRPTQHALDDDDDVEGDTGDESKLLSRYGVWLMVELCKPRDGIPVEILGRLLAMLFQWFDATAYLPDDNVGKALERLKPHYVCNWLKEVSKTHLEVILSCLLPHPVEYARVGGHWDTLSSRTSQIKEGLNRLCCLIPYDIVTFEVWDYVIPFWLEAIRTEVPEEERGELKVLLCKVFDIDMSPLPFDVQRMYHFIAERFENTTAPVQEQNLSWLQILTSLEILIPLPLLLDMFHMGLRSLSSPPFPGDHKDIHLQSSAPSDVKVDDYLFESPLGHTTSDPVENIFTFDTHRSEEQGEEKTGEREGEKEEEMEVLNVTCFIMMLDLLLRQIELQDLTYHLGVSNKRCKEVLSLLTQMLVAPWEGEHTCSCDDDISACTPCDMRALWYQLSADLVSFIVPKDKLELPRKELPSVDELQNKHRTFSQQQEKQAEHLGVTSLSLEEEVEADTTFNLEHFPLHLQLLHELLKDLECEFDTDVLFHLLTCLRLLSLHGECLNDAITDNADFLKYCLRRLLIPNLWKLLQAEHSHITTECVPLLLHCITLPSGADIFWKLIDNDFGSEDWKERFAAVEKVTVLARLITPAMVCCNQLIMTTLAHAYCSLIGSANDLNTAVSQRTDLYLQTIKQSAVECIRCCLEFQFDSVIQDRTMILQRLFLLSVILKDAEIFSWEFFFNRFDTLCLEAQLDIEKTADATALTDLQSSDNKSEHFLRKLNRARFALARTDSVRSVRFSFIGKYPYRRASSVPMHLLNHAKPPEPHAKVNKEKSYYRQQSAPQFRRGGSCAGLSGFTGYMFPGGSFREFTDDQSNFTALLQRAMELEGVDRDMVHQLVTLLMKFMERSDQENVNKEKNTSRMQNLVLRHLNLLLGYNQTKKDFSVPPYQLRCSAVFNAYLSGLPKVLDKNFDLGNIILPMALMLLQYCPSPQRYASDYQPPNYTLWYLEPHTRQSWFTAILVILYKYQYNTSPASGIVQTLMRIMINTVDAQIHQCKHHDDIFGPNTPVLPRHRDTSTVSAIDLENIAETETPPESPTNTSDDTSAVSMTTESTGGVQYQKKVKVNEGNPDLPRPIKTGDSFPTPTVSPAEQPQRIAEYDQGSVRSLGTREDKPTGDPLPEAGDSSVSLPLQRPLRKQKTEPILSYTSLGRQRTLEQSVEEYMMGEVSKKSAQKPWNSQSLKETSSKFVPSPTPQSTVDLKIAEQLEEFGSQHSGTKQEVVEKAPPRPCSVAIMPVLPPVFSTGVAGRIIDVGTFDKHFESLRSPSLEDVQESAEELDSPKKSIRSEDSTSRKAQHAPTDEGGTAEEAGVMRMKSVEAEEEKISDIRDSKIDEDEKTIGEEEKTNEAKKDSSVVESEIEETPCPSPSPSPTHSPKIKPNYRQRKARKTGLTTVEIQKAIPELADLGCGGESVLPALRRPRRSEFLNKGQHPSSGMVGAQKRLLSTMKTREQLLVDRCPDCNAVLERYDEDTISLGIICMSTFIYREPALAAPLLPDMLKCVARIAGSSPYPWQAEISGLIVPGNSVSVARQFLRCVLHQLASNGIFLQIFQMELEDDDFLKTIVASLADFADLNCLSALLLLLEGVNDMKSLTNQQMLTVVKNLSTYMDYVTMETSSATWSNILTQFDSFFRRLPLYLPNPCDMSPVLKVIITILKMPGLAAVKGILESFSKLLSFTILNCSFKLQSLLDICYLCNRAFSKERDKLILTRSIIFELVQALKFKVLLPDENLLLLVQFLCIDAGGTIGATSLVEDLANYSYNPNTHSLISSSATDCMRPHLNECIEFIAELHTINKLKVNVKNDSHNLNEDTLGGQLKAGLAQYVALELTRAIGRDLRAINRYLPWLYHPPSAMLQGPREFIDCVDHIRLLSWLLLGSLTHTAITKTAGPIVCQPLPLESSSHIADHIMVIMTGFAEQSKASVLHMSSLFHAFILCQLWTMYCECYASMNPPDSEAFTLAHTTIMDFWGRVTPGILQLLSCSKVLAEMVNLHFLSLMESLQESNSVLLAKLFPLWTPILYSYHSQLPGHVQVRLQICQNWEPRETPHDLSDTAVLLNWLRKLQFKLSQIEVQSSAATQFYIV